jgi:hypothetical protein
LERRVIAATAQGPYSIDDVASVPLLPPFARSTWWLPLILRSVAMPPAG